MTAASAARRPAAALARANRRLTLRLLLVTAAMFGFGYALVPLYDLVCDITGFNGRTGVVSEADAAAGRASPGADARTVRVQFLATVNGGLRWEFAGPARPLEVRPGDVYETEYTATNLSRRAVVGQAVPSVSPIAAAAHFNKVECFCFTRQRLEPGETRAMPVRFVVGRGLPPAIGTLTLGYTFFEVEPEPGAAAAAGSTAPAPRGGGDGLAASPLPDAGRAGRAGQDGTRTHG